MADPATKRCIVECDGVKLKLTCTPELLAKPLSECLIVPTLGFFNKKRGTSYAASDLAKVEVDGTVVSDLSLSGDAVLGAIDAPSVVLTLPESIPGPSDACIAAAERVLQLDPATTPTEDCLGPLKALRLAIKERPTAAAPAVKASIVGRLAEFCCLASEREWTAASAEAAVCLNNIFVVARDKAGAMLCAPELGVIARLAAVFEAAQTTPIARLRILAPLVFHISLVSNLGAPGRRLADAVRACLLWLSSTLEAPTALADEVVGAALASELLRASFNLLRTSPPRVGASSGAAEEEKAGGGATVPDDFAAIVRSLLSAPGGSEAAADAIREAQLASLQIPVVLESVDPDGYRKLCPAWKELCDILLPLMVTAEVEIAEEVSNRCVLPLLTLQKMAEADAPTRAALKEHIFGDVGSLPMSQADPYQPAGVSGWDPNEKLGASATLRMHLLKLLTSTAHTAKHVAGNMLFAVCGDNAEEFTHLVGLGSAAGLLSERGLFAQFQQMVDAKSEARIEEIN